MYCGFHFLKKTKDQKTYVDGGREEVEEYV
jgi:hypothetical protein